MDAFTKAMLTEAETERYKILAQVEEAFAAACAEAEKAARAETAERLKQERFKLEQVENKAIATALETEKKKVADLRLQLTESLRQNVVTQLHHYTLTEQYALAMLAAIEKCAATYQNIVVQLGVRDWPLADKIRKFSGVSVKEPAADDHAFIGGFIVFVQNGRGLLDYSFQTRLREEMRRTR